MDGPKATHAREPRGMGYVGENGEYPVPPPRREPVEEVAAALGRRLRLQGHEVEQGVLVEVVKGLLRTGMIEVRQTPGLGRLRGMP